MAGSRLLLDKRWLWIVIGLGVGAALAAVLVANRQSPSQEEAARAAPTLSVIKVQPLELRLEARGHGVARAAESWRATARVGGEWLSATPSWKAATSSAKAPGCWPWT
ncbi:MAG: hypothetical protein ABEK42_12475, partial [Thiohalorhabdaceae bacterium]